VNLLTAVRRVVDALARAQPGQHDTVKKPTGSSTGKQAQPADNPLPPQQEPRDPPTPQPVSKKRRLIRWIFRWQTLVAAVVACIPAVLAILYGPGSASSDNDARKELKITGFQHVATQKHVSGATTEQWTVGGTVKSLAPGELVIVLAIPVDKSGRQMLNTEVYASSSAVVNQGSWSVQIDTRVPPGASGLKFRAVILERCDHCDRSAPDQFDVPGSVPFPIPRGALSEDG
jgi:hypothetical protein